MKICELKIQCHADREKIVTALVNSGYKVSVEKIQKKSYSESDEYFVVIEDHTLT